MFRSAKFLIIIVILITSRLTLAENVTYHNDDPSRNNVETAKRDWYECSQQANANAASKDEYRARAAGDAAGMGGAGAGLAQLFLGLFTKENEQETQAENCMKARGWTRVK